MRFSDTIARLDAARADNWAIHRRAREMAEAGRDVIELAIGEPDAPVPAPLIAAVRTALRRGRTGYSAGAGEPGLRAALAARYTARTGRQIGPGRFLCFPGTQTALYAALVSVAGPGDEVLVGDPMYATYASVIAASGAKMVPVPLRAERNFRLDAGDVADRITDRTVAILLNTPHNPTGAVMTTEGIRALGAVAAAHDLWIVSDEVYDEMIHDGSRHVSPLDHSDLDARTVVVSSISKTHAAPGFRSGWCVASEAFCERVLPLSEAMLFGGPPFVADATALAVSSPSEVAAGMRGRFAARAGRLAERLHGGTDLRVLVPQAGMFCLMDVSATGHDGAAFATALLDRAGVAVMPGASFGTSLDGWVRVSLTQQDAVFDEAVRRIVAFAAGQCA